MVAIDLKSGHHYYIDGILKSNIDSLIYNLPQDWDFVIVISGNNMVRVGKSVLAQQLGAYAAERLGTPWGLHNITMDSKEMIDFAMKSPKHSVVVYDEAAEGLRAAKNAKEVIDSLLDFFDECGQLNHFFILVAPNFFRLKSDITIERSEYLINVYRSGVPAKDDQGNPVIRLKRGFFQFFNRTQKQFLYEKFLKTKSQNYSGVTRTIGNFSGVYTVDEEAYKEKKKKSLRRLKSTKQIYYKKQFNELLFRVKTALNIRAKELQEKFKIDLTERQINFIIKEEYEKGYMEAGAVLGGEVGEKYIPHSPEGVGVEEAEEGEKDETEV